MESPIKENLHIIDEHFATELYYFIQYTGKTYGAYHFWIDEEWEPLMLITKLVVDWEEKKNPANPFIDNRIVHDITYATRVYQYVKYCSDVLIEDSKVKSTYERLLNGCKLLVEYQRETMNDTDKWYFKNLDSK